MNDLIKFQVEGKPQGKARARTFYNSRIHKMQSITPENTANYENLIKVKFLQSQKECGYEKSIGEVKVEIAAFYEIPKSWSKKKKEDYKSNDFKPLTKPDLDNIAKVVLDALNGLAFDDDSQVVDLHLTKHYSDQAKVEVLIYSL